MQYIENMIKKAMTRNKDKQNKTNDRQAEQIQKKQEKMDNLHISQSANTKSDQPI